MCSILCDSVFWKIDDMRKARYRIDARIKTMGWF